MEKIVDASVYFVVLYTCIHNISMMYMSVIPAVVFMYVHDDVRGTANILENKTTTTAHHFKRTIIALSFLTYSKNYLSLFS